jgi:hypothetical protein
MRDDHLVNPHVAKCHRPCLTTWWELPEQGSMQPFDDGHGYWKDVAVMSTLVLMSWPGLACVVPRMQEVQDEERGPGNMA